MINLRRVAALTAVAALGLVPAGSAFASHSHAGQHGNHCGLGHSKHSKAVGRSCHKTKGHKQ